MTLIAQATQDVVASADQRVEIPVPRKMDVVAFMRNLRYMLHKIYPCGVMMSREQRRGGMVLHVQKPTLAGG